MTDVFREIEEAIREDRAKELWQRYGTWIIAAAVVLVVAVGGYTYWRSHRAAEAREQTVALADDFARASADPAATAQALTTLAEQAGVGRATLARLRAAGLRAEAGDRDGAVAQYRALAADAAVDGLWRDFARLLAVLHQIDSGDPAALRAELEPLTADGNPWRYSARELTGLLALRTGDRARAREVFSGLAEDPSTPAGVRSRAGELSGLLAAPEEHG